jgi:hypothetical protein
MNGLGDPLKQFSAAAEYARFMVYVAWKAQTARAKDVEIITFRNYWCRIADAPCGQVRFFSRRGDHYESAKGARI